jgi:aspartate-semialdehyde dehydrogenase
MHTPSSPIPVALLGATGSVGQRFVQLLDGHPWFRLTRIAASERSVGRRYADAVRWSLPESIPIDAAELVLQPADEPGPERLVFSALDASVAGELESIHAAAGALVVTNARNHRMDAGVPLVVPELNGDQLELLERGRGGIIANPNCSTIGLTLALGPLQSAFGVRRVMVTTMQALSGAGLDGLRDQVVEDNLIPLIAGEEAKLETEAKKILGVVDGGAVRAASLAISATCVRVPISDGHTLSVSVQLDRAVELGELRAAWEGFEVAGDVRALPSAPERPFVLLDEPDAPQPRLHRMLGDGMTASIGRVRECPLLDWKFVTLSHNTLRGAAGGALLAAELAVARGYLPERA